MFELLVDDPPFDTPAFLTLTDDNADRTTAMILGVTLGGVVYEQTIGGATYARGLRTLKLRVEPLDDDPYEAELVLDPEESMVPAKPGTRLPVLVDRSDRCRLSLPAFNRWFALPGGIVWQPPMTPAYSGF
jgi:hypothetical protein